MWCQIPIECFPFNLKNNIKYQLNRVLKANLFTIQSNHAKSIQFKELLKQHWRKKWKTYKFQSTSNMYTPSVYLELLIKNIKSPCTEWWYHIIYFLLTGLLHIYKPLKHSTFFRFFWDEKQGTHFFLPDKWAFWV